MRLYVGILKSLRIGKKITIEEISNYLNISKFDYLLLENHFKAISILTKEKLINFYRLKYSKDESVEKFIKSICDNNNFYLKIRNVLVILIILLVFVFTLKTFSDNSSKNDILYKLYGTSEIIEFKNGLIEFGYFGNSLEISEFSLVEKIDTLTTFDINIYLNGKLWSNESYKTDDGKFENWIKERLIFVEKVPSVCSNKKNCSGGLVKEMNKKEFPNNLRVEINYCISDDCTKEDLDIYYKELINND